MFDMTKIKTITKYPEINKVLSALTEGITNIFENELIGVYLLGSLTYGDFKPGRSDIDLMVVIKYKVTDNQLIQIKSLHNKIDEIYPEWNHRIECSYTPIAMLSSIVPPGSRPYYGEGVLYPTADYGYEWIVNEYILYTYGIALIGPAFKTISPSIDINEVKRARVQDLIVEWLPKKKDPKYFENSHYQSYFVLHMCRILHTLVAGKVGSKKSASDWAKNEYPEFANLIETAESWEYGKDMKMKSEAIKFLDLAINKSQNLY